jgi:hypothetical protein
LHDTPQFTDGGRWLPGWDNVGYKTLVTPDVLLCQNGHLLDRLMLKESRLNFGRLHPVSPDFDLIVFATQVLQAAICS